MKKVIDKTEHFIERINEVYGDKSDAIVAAISNPQKKTFRINTFKANESEVLKSLESQGFTIFKSNLPNAFIVESSTSDKKLSETNESLNNQIYIQNLSSMLPVIKLDPKPNEKILDLCAAPGSKTTQIADLTKNNAEIIAVEKSKNRFFKLKNILNSYGATNIKIYLEDGRYLHKKYTEFNNYFDKVLVDAPCSSEGIMRLNKPNALKFWNRNKYKDFIKLQRRLLQAGFEMLKPGGTLVYSTCTMNVYENEMIVDWGMRKLKVKSEELRVVSKEQITIPKAGTANNKEQTKYRVSIVDGVKTWKDREFEDGVESSLRILPTDVYSGFYVMKFKKL